jgi:hypothetical protein
VEVSREDEIRSVRMGAPHLVLIGAGASRAAFPQGDGTGRKLPVMADFLECVPGVKEILDVGISDFEAAYSAIASDPSRRADCAELERLIYEYFDEMRLPSRPTLYDHLVMALRPKDVIATFNWDPFLIQAIRRSSFVRGRCPHVLFLHGNVLMGYCHLDRILGTRRTRCSKCQQPFQASSLLFPVTRKDYRRDPTIAAMWEQLEVVLRQAFMVTIFGYGAPSSDVEAVGLLKAGWGRVEDRQMEQFELIDIQSEDVLCERWGQFIHTHHYEIHDSFYDSWIAQHPRRTGEAYLNQYLEAQFIEPNPLPRGASFAELENWIQPLIKAEDSSVSDQGRT